MSDELVVCTAAILTRDVRGVEVSLVMQVVVGANGLNASEGKSEQCNKRDELHSLIVCKVGGDEEIKRTRRPFLWLG